jgi:hypothetical protein
LRALVEAEVFFLAVEFLAGGCLTGALLSAVDSAEVEDCD